MLRIAQEIHISIITVLEMYGSSTTGIGLVVLSSSKNRNNQIQIVYDLSTFSATAKLYGINDLSWVH